MTVPGSSEHVRSYYEQAAGEYDQYVSHFERWFIGDGRQWVCGQAAGDVLEIAIGTGRNLPFYPQNAARFVTDNKKSTVPAELKVAHIG